MQRFTSLFDIVFDHIWGPVVIISMSILLESNVTCGMYVGSQLAVSHSSHFHLHDMSFNPWHHIPGSFTKLTCIHSKLSHLEKNI